ncbi:MAG: methyltransferase domain-containing protein [Betaproteobacteria bacterium]
MPADHGQSIVGYRAVAARYDHATRRINRIRLQAVDALQLRPGQTVLDVGCGSGFSFAAILGAIGPTGCLLAFDHSPELLAIAKGRIADAGWENVVLRESTAEQVDFRGVLAARNVPPPSALLFSYVHDVLQSKAALDNLFAQAAPGARVAMCGTKLWPWWGWPVNLYLRVTHRHYITNRDENFDRPWAKIATRLEDFGVEVRWPPGWRYVGGGYIAGAREKDTTQTGRPIGLPV